MRPLPKAKGRPKRGDAKAAAEPGAKGKGKAEGQAKAKVKNIKTKDEEAAAKAKLDARKEQASKVKRRCRGCRKMLLGTCFRYNEPFCYPCNATMESIRKICDRQNRAAWFQTQRLHESTASPLIGNFRGHKKAVEAGEKTDKWSSAEAQQTLAVTHEADFVDAGELMNKDMFIDWETKVKIGTKLTYTEACAKFEGWEKAAKAAGFHTDPMGEEIDNEWFFRVHTGYKYDIHKKVASTKAMCYLLLCLVLEAPRISPRHRFKHIQYTACVGRQGHHENERGS